MSKVSTHVNMSGIFLPYNISRQVNEEQTLLVLIVNDVVRSVNTGYVSNVHLYHAYIPMYFLSNTSNKGLLKRLQALLLYYF